MIIFCTEVILYISKINSLSSLSSVQLARFTLFVFPIVIENTISDIRSLLNFSNKSTGTNTMHTTASSTVPVPKSCWAWAICSSCP